jgi:flagellar basal-body rod modification protein FlgD
MITSTLPDLDLGSLALSKPADTRGSSELGQEDFLVLMTTQFQNQDPLQPTESGEFISQMAQFSTVSGIGDLNSSMNALAESMFSGQALQAATMIGRNVLIDGEWSNFDGEQPLQGAVDLPYPTSAGLVRIFDAGGQVVRDIQLGTRNSGTATFEWDGLLEDGTTAPPGNYRIAGALLNGAEELALPTFAAARVQSISLGSDGRGPQITTADGQEMSLSQVKAIM